MQPVDADEQQRIRQRTASFAEYRHQQHFVQKSVYADVTFAPREADAAEENAEHTAQHIHE